MLKLPEYHSRGPPRLPGPGARSLDCIPPRCNELATTEQRVLVYSGSRGSTTSRSADALHGAPPPLSCVDGPRRRLLAMNYTNPWPSLPLRAKDRWSCEEDGGDFGSLSRQSHTHTVPAPGRLEQKLWGLMAELTSPFSICFSSSRSPGSERWAKTESITREEKQHWTLVVAPGPARGARYHAAAIVPHVHPAHHHTNSSFHARTPCQWPEPTIWTAVLSST